MTNTYMERIYESKTIRKNTIVYYRVDQKVEGIF